MTTPEKTLQESRERLTALDGQGRNVERVLNVFAQVLWDLVEVAAAQQEALAILAAAELDRQRVAKPIDGEEPTCP